MATNLKKYLRGDVMEEFLGTDFSILNGITTAPDGDIGLVTGRSCLIQDLRNRLSTPRGALRWHPLWGVPIYDYIQLEGTEINRLDLVMAIKDEVEKESRVESETTIVEMQEWTLQQIKIRVTCQPVGDAVPLSLVMFYGIFEISSTVING
jgi:hypothetical protein